MKSTKTYLLCFIHVVFVGGSFQNLIPGLWLSLLRPVSKYQLYCGLCLFQTKTSFGNTPHQNTR